MPPVPPAIIIGGGLLAAAGAAYIVYRAYQASAHAHELEAAKHEGLDAGVPQTVSE